MEQPLSISFRPVWRFAFFEGAGMPLTVAPRGVVAMSQRDDGTVDFFLTDRRQIRGELLSHRSVTEVVADVNVRFPLQARFITLSAGGRSTEQDMRINAYKVQGFFKTTYTGDLGVMVETLARPIYRSFHEVETLLCAVADLRHGLVMRSAHRTDYVTTSAVTGITQTGAFDRHKRTTLFLTDGKKLTTDEPFDQVMDKTAKAHRGKQIVALFLNSAPR
jgi:hypothetical protein